MDTLISASILNADMSALGSEICRAERGGADWIHLDVMDGVFVDCITFGDYMLHSLRPRSKMTFDTHLMVYDPTKLVPLFAKAGSDIITIHEESRCDCKAVLRGIHALGLKAGIAVNPETPAENLLPFLGEADMFLIMTVNPGYGGQGFIKETLSKVSFIRNEAERRGLKINIQVDGGINVKTAKAAKEAGANILVAGTFLFKNEDKSDEKFNLAVKSLKEA